MSGLADRWFSLSLSVAALACGAGDSETAVLNRTLFALDRQVERAAQGPLVRAERSIGKSRNLEASVPLQCYTKTGGRSNPCWTCHTKTHGLNAADDWDLQEEYAFSDFALINRWSNAFADKGAAIQGIGDDVVLAWIRSDNYTPLAEALRRRADYPGYVPDLDFGRGFDAFGFARDGSGWRGVRYKPFPGTFWPTNGSTDDVFIRLPKPFRSDRAGRESLVVYRANLAILESALVADADSTTDPAPREIEALDERELAADLDGDGKRSVIRWLSKLPRTYVGGADDVNVRRGVYPGGTELLHSVRYVDPDDARLLSRRMKELRYMRKTDELDTWGVARGWELEKNEKEEGNLPVFPGSPEVGYKNAFGWQLQGFIEDATGRLRLQTEEEHRFCMGCHSAIGVTIDSTFSVPRKIPGADGWRPQDLRGIQDVPQHGHRDPEIFEYFARVGGGDELRANDEVLARFFPEGKLDSRSVRRASVGGDRDITYLIAPSRERALLLDKAYLVLVREQSFALGRDTLLAPAKNVHAHIQNGSTELAAAGKIYADGDLRLVWTNPALAQ